MSKMTLQHLEARLWRVFNVLRRRTSGQNRKTSILSLMLVNRRSGQWDYEADEKRIQLEQARGWPFADSKRAMLRASPHINHLRIHVGWHWSDVLAVGENTGEAPTKAMCGIAANPELSGVFTADRNQPASDGRASLESPNRVGHRPLPDDCSERSGNTQETRG
jgi:hypothetical protein